MNPIKVVYCRAVQTVLRAALPVLPYREPVIYRSCEELNAVFCAENIRRVLVVTDEGIVRSGIAARLENVLRDNGIAYTVYSGTCPNPTVKNVEQALALYRRENCQALIAIGGGSSMDCAKAVGARVARPDTPLGKLKGTLKIWRKIPTLIAIPTTAGTGSEATLAAVITDGEKKHKYVMNDFVLIPHYAVLDASLTYSLPPHLTATTGMDALTHAVEAYIGRATTRETREKALEATRLVFANVERAYRNGQDGTARANMLTAAYLAGVAFTRSYVGYIHAIAHSLGGQYNIPHGLANAVIMPYVLEAYGECIHGKLHELGVAAGVCTPEEPDGQAAAKFIQAIRELNARMGIPERLKGICPEDIPVMAAHAEKEANPLYPVPRLLTQVELEKFYHRIAEEEQHGKQAS
ncbi:MAG: iron-containing alcohol dehydrogenase [Candidatus Faecousia sp.]|nr:iron-containing alcohol dehydrogenase [Candidatus Faecousia sp.]